MNSGRTLRMDSSAVKVEHVFLFTVFITICWPWNYYLYLSAKPLSCNSTENLLNESMVTRLKRQYSASADQLLANADADSNDDSSPKSGREKLTEQDVISRILHSYNWRVRPSGLNTSNKDTGGPVIVTVNIYMRSVSKIDDVNMEYSTQFTFREEWWDTRLAYKKLSTDERTSLPPFVILAHGQLIWMPDTFFQNEKEARKHDIDKPNILLRIYPDGKILYSVRLSMVLSCPMGLEYYPLDNQTCLIELASYAYTTEDIKYEWKTEEPVQLKKGIEKSLPSFKLMSTKTGYCTSKTATGEYSCLRTTLFLKREYSFYIIQLYIPSFMLVVVSWVNFWIDKDAVPARVSLGVTTLLTMTTQASGVNAKLPPVSYTKAIDVWIGVCLAFIFGALLEFAFVNYAGRQEFLEKERKKPAANLSSLPNTVPVRFPNQNSMKSYDNAPMASTTFWNSTAITSSPLTHQKSSLQMGNMVHHSPLSKHLSGGSGVLLPPMNGGNNQHQSISINASVPYCDLSIRSATQQKNVNACPQCSSERETTLTPPSYHRKWSKCRASNPPEVPLIVSGTPANVDINFLNATATNPLPPHSRMSFGHRRSPTLNPFRWARNYIGRQRVRSKKIDVISQFVFPIGFFFFNCVYWSVYLI